MNVRFIAPNPRHRARPILDTVLAVGTEQIAIACAFLTPGGADYVIEIESGVPRLTGAKPHTATPSQGVFRVDTIENPKTVWLTESPAPKLERVVGARWVSEVDPEFRKFFTKQSLTGGGGLLHQEYRSIKSVMHVSRKEVGNVESPDLKARLETSESTELIIDEAMERDDKFAFIYRAKYRA